VRYLVLADIHGNWEALETVLATTAFDHADQVLVLGDLVGYGAGPNRVVDKVRELTEPDGVIRGNHDKVVAQLDDGWSFNSVARQAARWTTEQLSEENLHYLCRLPQGPVEVAPGLVICHGSPLDEDEYLLSPEAAAEVFAEHSAHVTFFGHTHVPCLFVAGEEDVSMELLTGDSRTIEVAPDKRYLVNPGSVGQPRDRDPRAAYLVYDSELREIVWGRQTYPLEVAQEMILTAGLPRVLAYRLAAGL
jgi:predicted phosphodiesterase